MALSRRPDLSQGNHVRCLEMVDDDPVAAGSVGTVDGEVTWFSDAWHVPVRWDSGRWLALMSPPDRWEREGP